MELYGRLLTSTENMPCACVTNPKKHELHTLPVPFRTTLLTPTLTFLFSVRVETCNAAFLLIELLSDKCLVHNEESEKMSNTVFLHLIESTPQHIGYNNCPLSLHWSNNINVKIQRDSSEMHSALTLQAKLWKRKSYLSTFSCTREFPSLLEACKVYPIATTESISSTGWIFPSCWYK